MEKAKGWSQGGGVTIHMYIYIYILVRCILTYTYIYIYMCLFILKKALPSREVPLWEQDHFAWRQQLVKHTKVLHWMGAWRPSLMDRGF